MRVIVVHRVSPIFRDSDIKKLAKRFRVKTHQFIDSYLKTDSDGDYVLRTAPCPFLWEDDNTCSVYEDRPLACKEYPHTNRKNMYQIFAYWYTSPIFLYSLHWTPGAI